MGLVRREIISSTRAVASPYGARMPRAQGQKFCHRECVGTVSSKSGLYVLGPGGVVRKNKRVDLIEAWESAWPCFDSVLRPVGARVGTARFGCCRNGRVFLRPSRADDDRLHTTAFTPITIVPPADIPTDRDNQTPLLTRPCELAHFSTPRASDQCVASLLTERPLRDLPTQLLFEASTMLPSDLVHGPGPSTPALRSS